MWGFLTAAIGALPALLQGVSAYQAKRAELIKLRKPDYAGTIAADDAEIARERAAEAEQKK